MRGMSLVGIVAPPRIQTSGGMCSPSSMIQPTSDSKMRRVCSDLNGPSRVMHRSVFGLARRERPLLPPLSRLADHSREAVHSPEELEIQQAKVRPGTEPFVEGGAQILFLAGHAQRGHATGRWGVCVFRVGNAV